MNGLLIVTQTRRGHERMADLLEQLRRERAIMISIEARFCQVSDEFLQDITLDADITINQPGQHWTGDVTPPITPAPTVISQTGSGGMGTATLLPLAGTAFAAFTANEGGMFISGTFLDDIQVGFLLRAIQADVRSTTLQAPRVTLYNGQRAYISDVTVVTYISDATPVVSEMATSFDPTIGAVPVGATLDVKASVSADRRYVQMDLRPQQIALGTPNFRTYTITGTGSSIDIDLPQIVVQDYKTTVSVPDGGTLLLGGTRKYTEMEAETGVPILSRVPILKRLFNNRASLRSAKNLLILIRPKIIIQSEEENKLGYDDF
jgi:general secretion pathway protein D